MSLSALPLSDLCDTAIAAAQAAGDFIQSVDREKITRQYKDAGSSAASKVVTDVDLRSESIIRECLRESCSRWDIAFVGEESSQYPGDQPPDRFSKSHFWCVDPLDGTLPFVEGRSGYAVSIALVKRSGVPLIGVVYDPASGTLLHAVKGQGACRDRSSMDRGKKESAALMVFADGSLRAQDDYEKTVRVLNACAKDSGLDGIELVYGNGAVRNACQVLDYATACYIKLPKFEDGGGSIWDFAATACIAREAGAWASNIQGGSLDLNRRDSTFMNHQGVVFASSEQIGEFLIEELPRLSRASASS
jgi:3'(2'), 5'-bisphosphate nucleotidase/myo-inositol-1(or 4)-monophosphatase